MLTKIKQHLRDNKATYIASSVTATIAVGVTYFLMKNGKYIEISGDPEIAIPVMQAANVVGDYNTVHQTVVNFIERSTPSKPIGLLSEDGKSIKQAFPSISEAARSTGHQAQMIGKNVNGHITSVKGDVFKALDEAA